MVIKKNIVFGLSTLVGTIIGVGIFGIPYAAAKVGFWVACVFLVVLAVIIIAVNLFYAEVASKTKGMHRLPGYAGLYFGTPMKRVALIVATLSLFGSLLAYLIIGGQFLANIFHGSVFLYTAIFFLVGAFLIWQDQRSIGPVEFILLVIFLALGLFLFVAGFSHIQTANLQSLNLNYLFLPYGVFLFSLWGTSIIPEIKEQVNDNRALRKVIIWSVIISAAVYLFFMLVVVGVAGGRTTTDAISGLEGRLGSWVISVGYLFGILTTFTSFIALGLTMKKILWYDYGMPKRFAWLITCVVPLILYVAGLKNFIQVISLTGAVMLGLEGVIIIALYLHLKKQESPPRYRRYAWLGTCIASLLILGVLLELFYSLIGF